MDRTHLAGLLSSYHPSDMRERGYVERMQRLLGENAAFEREFFVPGHFTASAFVLSPDQSALLLIFHRKLRLWLQPGGHVEPTDTDILAAARREAAEEVGLERLEALNTAIFDVDIHHIPARKTDPAHEHFDVRFVFRAPSLDFFRSDEVADARWVELDDIERVTSDASVQRAVAKLGTRSNGPPK